MNRVFAATILVFCLASTASASLVVNIGGNDFTTGGGNGATLDSDAIIMSFFDSSENGTTGYGLASNEVRLNIFFKGGGAGSSAKISDMLFNIKDNPDFAPAGFDIASADATFTGWDFAGKDKQKHKYGNFGLFDLKIFFDTSSGSELLKGETIALTISTDAALSTSLFDETATERAFYAAAHVNATGNGNSGHYAGLKGDPDFGGDIPEPATLAVWSILGVCGIGGAGLRRRKAKAKA